MLYKNPLGFWELSLFKKFTQVIHGISDRSLGNMKAKSWSMLEMSLKDEKTWENLNNFSKKIGFSSSEIVLMNQIHSDLVWVAKNYDAGKRIQDTDGLIAKEKNLYLLATTADCLSIFFYDPIKKVVGLAHAGWRGTIARISQHMIGQLRSEFGSNPRDLICGLGPSVAACCYEVKKDVADKFERLFGRNSPFVQEREGKIFVDLPGANYRLLRGAGIKKENIDLSFFCTFCDNDKFFSLRKEGLKLEGETAAIIGLKD